MKISNVDRILDFGRFRLITTISSSNLSFNFLQDFRRKLHFLKQTSICWSKVRKMEVFWQKSLFSTKI